MTDAEEIEFNRVLEALDIAKRRLREVKKTFPHVLSDWANGVLDEIEEAEGKA